MDVFNRPKFQLVPCFRPQSCPLFEENTCEIEIQSSLEENPLVALPVIEASLSGSCSSRVLLPRDQIWCFHTVRAESDFLMLASKF